MTKYTKAELCQMWNRPKERQIAVMQSKIIEAFKPKKDGGAGYLEACMFLNKYCKCKIKIPKI